MENQAVKKSTPKYNNISLVKTEDLIYHIGTLTVKNINAEKIIVRLTTQLNNTLSRIILSQEQAEALRASIEQLQKDNKQLEDKISELNSKLQKHKNMTGNP